MGDFLGVLVFIVVVILSFASKQQEARKIAQKKREDAERKPQQLSGKSQQQIHGRRSATRTATAKPGSTPVPQPRRAPRRAPKPVEQELLETLFGVKGQEEEPPPVPTHADASTEEMVQRMREGSAEPRHAQARGSSSGQQRRTTPEDMHRRQEAVRRKQEAARRKQEAARKHAHDQQMRARGQQQERKAQRERSLHDHPHAHPATGRRRRKRSMLFSGAEDVRRAVIFSEVLGQPKSMRQDNSW